MKKLFAFAEEYVALLFPVGFQLALLGIRVFFRGLKANGGFSAQFRRFCCTGGVPFAIHQRKGARGSSVGSVLISSVPGAERPALCMIFTLLGGTARASLLGTLAQCSRPAEATETHEFQGYQLEGWDA